MFIRKIRAVKVISPDFGSLFDEQGKKENYKKKKKGLFQNWLV